ncbi:MAG: hypothetical protein ACLTYN_07315 [Dysosmobacter welbionis]
MCGLQHRHLRQRMPGRGGRGAHPPPDRHDHRPRDQRSRNLIVPIGTPSPTPSRRRAACGDVKVIAGGPMMGRSQADLPRR